MNAFAWSSAIIIVTHFFMAVLLFLKSHDKAGRLWALFCIFVIPWGLGGYGFATTKSLEIAFKWWQIASICIIVVPILFLNFVLVLLNLKKKYLLLFLYSAAAFFLALNFLSKQLYLGGLVFIFNQFYWHDWIPNKNLSFLIFYIGFYWGVLLYSFSLLLKALSKATGAKRLQLKYLILGTSIGWIGAHGNFFNDFGLRVYPFCNFLIGIYTIIISYAIIRHQLLDINIIFRKGLVYSILAAIITALFFSLFLLVEKLFQGFMGYQSIIATVLTGFIIALGFNPLRNKIQHLLDKLFFRGTAEEIAEENERLRQELERTERLRSIGILAAGMAHEIKNPLTSIKTFTEYLPKQYQSPEFREKFENIVGREVERINAIVKNILIFAKPQDLTLADVDIQNVLDEILELLSNELLKRKIALNKNYQHRGQLIKADYNQLKQTFLNIILNALDAMPSGGELTISTLTTNNQLLTTIEDTGTGISKADLKNLFNPFFTRKDQGSGLGLTVAYGIIQRHKGKIEVESEVGKGTKFTIKFPTNG